MGTTLVKAFEKSPLVNFGLNLFLALIAVLLPKLALSDECPGPENSTVVVRNAISDFQKNDQAPFGADCAYQWASSMSLDASSLDGSTMSFFSVATDIQRRAAEKRYDEGNTVEGDQYLDHEIALRQRFLKAALNVDSTVTNARKTEGLHTAVVQNISYLVSALALRREYNKVAETLDDEDSSDIDDEALKVWLQAVWSCARWDGRKRDLCPDRSQCKESVEDFLEAVESMKNRHLPHTTARDIAALKNLAENGCLK